MILRKQMNTFFLACHSAKIKLFLMCTQRISLLYLYDDIIPFDINMLIVSILIRLYVEKNGDRVKCRLLYRKSKLYSCVGIDVCAVDECLIDEDREFENSEDKMYIEIPNFISYSLGRFHSMVLTKEGLFACGNNIFGQLGLGDNQDRIMLTKMNISNVISFECIPSRVSKYPHSIYTYYPPFHSTIITEEGIFHTGEYPTDDPEKQWLHPTNILTKINI